MTSEALHLPAGYSLVALDEVGSTNDEAKRLASEGAPAGTLVWARSQTAGRGRRGRRWLSPPGNLYCSLLLRPGCPPFTAAQVSFVAALGLSEAVEALVPQAEPRCKWPNDILLRGRKLAGVLVESSMGEGARLDWLVLGLGVNVAAHPSLPGGEAATSLGAEGGGGVSVGQTLEAFLARFEPWRRRWEDEGFAPVREAWLERAAGLGEPVTVRLERERFEGRFSGVSETGELVITLASGDERRFSAGDVRLTRAA